MGGVKGYNIKENYSSGKPRLVAGELYIADRHVLPKVSPPLGGRGFTLLNMIHSKGPIIFSL
jgi:hypothetical protein